MIERKLRVYISSTSIDFAESRKELATQLRGTGYEPIYMGEYSAAAVAPIEKVLKDVASCDLYIGLFAFWYGEPIASTGKSHTHMEYCEAKEKNIPRLIFLLDERADWKPSWCERGKRSVLMEALREELLQQKSHMLCLFKDLRDLLVKVPQAIYDWKSSLADCEAAEQHARVQAEDVPATEAAGEAVVGLRFQDVRCFKDRRDELAQMHRAIVDQDVKLLSVVGRSGTGKTALASRFGEIVEQRGHVIPGTSTHVDGIVYFSCRRAGGTLSERLWYEIARLLPQSRRDELQGVWTDTTYAEEEKFLELASRFQQGFYLLFLDGFEAVLGRNGVADSGMGVFLDVLLRTRHSLRVVLTTETNVEVSPDNRRFCRQINLDKGLPPDEAVELLRSFDPDGELELDSVSDDVLLRVVERCDGLPRTLIAVVGILSNDETLSVERMLNDKTIWTKLVEEQFERFAADRRRALEVLAVFDTPVPRQAVEYVIDKLAGAAANPFVLATADKLSNHVKQCLSDLVRGQIVTASRQRGTYEIQSRMQEYVYRQIPEGGENFSRRQCHRLVADYFSTLRTPSDSWHAIEDIQPQMNEFEHRIRACQYSLAAEVLQSVDEDCLQLWGRHQQLVIMHKRLVGNLESPQQARRNLGSLALATRRLGRLDDAVVYFQQAIESADGDFVTTADLLTELGNTYADAVEMDRAFLSYEKAIEIAHEQGYLQGEARALGNLAIAHRQVGQITMAVQYYDKAIALTLRKLKNAANSEELRNGRRWYATHMGNRGKALLTLGQVTEGLACLDEAIQISQEIHYLDAIAVFTRHKAEAKLLQYRFTEALEICEATVEHLSEFGQSRNLSYALLTLAEAQCQVGKWDEAARSCRRGVDLQNIETKASFQIVLGILEIRAGNGEAGQALLAQAIESCDRLIDKTPHFYDAIFDKALAELAAGRLDAAFAAYKAGLAICSAPGVRHAARDRCVLLNQVCPATPGLQEAIALLEDNLPPIS